MTVRHSFMTFLLLCLRPQVQSLDVWSLPIHLLFKRALERPEMVVQHRLRAAAIALQLLSELLRMSLRRLRSTVELGELIIVLVFLKPDSWPGITNKTTMPDAS